MVNILKCVIVEFKPLVVRMANVVATWSLNKFQKEKKRLSVVLWEGKHSRQIMIIVIDVVL